MNTLRLSGFTKLPMRLWRRFQISRAMRMYRDVSGLEHAAKTLKAEADELMRRHAEDPQKRLDLGDD